MKKQIKQNTENNITNIALAVIATFLICFTVVILFIFYRTSNEPSTLITSVFAACTGELGFMAFIKNSKNKYKQDEDENENGPVG